MRVREGEQIGKKLGWGEEKKAKRERGVGRRGSEPGRKRPPGVESSRGSCYENQKRHRTGKEKKSLIQKKTQRKPNKAR